MTEDRRSYDPYAPPPPPVTGDEPEPPEQAPGDLEDLPKTELVQKAEERGVPTYGTKADIASRLRGAE